MSTVHPTLPRLVVVTPEYDADALDGQGVWTVDANVDGVRYTITRESLADAVADFCEHCEDVGGASVALILPSDKLPEVLATDKTLRAVAQSWMVQR